MYQVPDENLITDYSVHVMVPVTCMYVHTCSEIATQDHFWKLKVQSYFYMRLHFLCLFFTNLRKDAFFIWAKS